MGVLSRTGHVHVRFERALNVRDLARQSLNDAKAERTAVDREIDAIVCIGRLDVSRLRSVGSFSVLRAEKRRRKVSLRGDPLIGVLLELRVDRETTRLVAESTANRLVGELSEAAIGDLELAVHNRVFACALDGRGRIQPAR